MIIIFIDSLFIPYLTLVSVASSNAFLLISCMIKPAIVNPKIAVIWATDPLV